MEKKIYWIIGGIIAIFLVIAILKAFLKPEIKPVRIKIGFLGPLTGGAASYGIEARNGAQLAISELNQMQTKYEYELMVLDSKAEPSLAEKGARELSADKEVLAVIGELTSSCTLAAGKIFQENKVPLVSPASTSPKITDLGEFVFRVVPSDTYQGRALAEFVVQDFGYEKIGILWDAENAAYSGYLADVFTERAQELGATIVERLEYRAGQKDFTSLLEKLRASNPQVIFIPGYYTEAALIAQQIQAMGWDVPLIGGDGWYSPDLIKLGGKAVEGAKFTAFFSSKDPRPIVQRFVRVYQERFGEEPGWVAAHGYDAMMVIAKALERGGVSREGIQKALAEIKGYEGVTGIISFDENGDVVKDILKIEIREGEFQLWAR